jgi:hypothetical protein
MTGVSSQGCLIHGHASCETGSVDYVSAIKTSISFVSPEVCVHQRCRPTRQREQSGRQYADPESRCLQRWQPRGNTSVTCERSRVLTGI